MKSCTMNATVYPRVCGGTSLWIVDDSGQDGLSPRVRGNHRKPGVQANAFGSIPACAGEPPEIAPVCSTGEVYPRVCGGTADNELRPLNGAGLSPRVRGNLKLRKESERKPRSIPACAGEPHMQPIRMMIRKVYPRVCGGTRRKRKLPGSVGGLSPRVRGNHSGDEVLLATERSIPACAGEPG